MRLTLPHEGVNSKWTPHPFLPFRRQRECDAFPKSDRRDTFLSTAALSSPDRVHLRIHSQHRLPFEVYGSTPRNPLATPRGTGPEPD